jgi:hypothetical protein
LKKTIISIALISIKAHISFAQLKVMPSGNVGVGINDPFSKLHVFSTCGDWQQAVTTKIQSRRACA